MSEDYTAGVGTTISLVYRQDLQESTDKVLSLARAASLDPESIGAVVISSLGAFIAEVAHNHSSDDLPDQVAEAARDYLQRIQEESNGQDDFQQ